MAGQGKRRATYGRLLLLAALLFGIVTMHTVGHPAEHGAPASGMTAAHEVPAGDPVAHLSAAAPAAGLDAPAAGPVAPVAAALGAALGAHSPDGAPMGGMDPLSVCLAVLGAWGLALLGSWLLGLRAFGRPLGSAAGGRWLRALWPNPPPRTSVLAQVSVLRI
ncbi:hypothetical protein PUR49_18255 [Streptomyces sp. BE147]|uniref:hypothetical protein n=1 Tax=Streptomyces sp. BE147 TaxID=3002524 RepID=UPI002E772B95|nr:hypothetical protein [Streptomyces sp. BE147]MEE1738440.1 hypothetical protein [Streptomyces sp. BE147]